jgi:hypothetical protein
MRNGRGAGGNLQRAEHGLEQRDDLLAQRAQQRVVVIEFTPCDALVQPAHDALGDLDADVGGEHVGLEFLQQLVVDLSARQQIGQIVGEPGVATVQLAAHPREKTLAARFFARGRRGRPIVTGGRCGWRRRFGSGARRRRRVGRGRRLRGDRHIVGAGGRLRAGRLCAVVSVGVAFLLFSSEHDAPVC